MEKPKSKYAKSKKHKSKIKEKKREKKERQKEKKNGKKWTCPFAFFFNLPVDCFLPLFCFFPGKKPKKTQKKQIEKAKKNANGQVHFSHFFTLFDVPFFPFILFPVFFGFEVLLFHFPCVFFFLHFFKFKKH